MKPRPLKNGIQILKGTEIHGFGCEAYDLILELKQDEIAYFKGDVKSAVTWFKKEYVRYMKKVGIKNVTEVNGVSKLIDEAFEDII